MDRGSNEKVLKAPDEGILKGHIKQYIFLLVENCMEGEGGGAPIRGSLRQLMKVF